MENMLYLAVCILAILVVVLGIKVFLLQKEIRELDRNFAAWFEMDTNTLMDISAGNKYVRQLAVDMNRQLKILREQRQKYLTGDRELKDAVTNISHDLRTPLTAIYGYLDLLEKEEKSDAVERYLEVIRNRTEILKQLTEELFKYSVIMTANDELELEQVDVGSVLEESIAAYYTALSEKGIMPEIQMPEGKVICKGNHSAVSRIFSNLLNNAIKYSDGDLEIILSEDGAVSFSNTASGLNEIQVAQLFDRFYTVEAARKSTGLGLAITRTLVERMGGTVQARYEEGRLSICIKFMENM